MRIQEVALRHAGLLRQFLTDDKGTVAILVWGCPPMAHIDNPVRACRAAVELYGALKTLDWASMGPSVTELVAGGVTMGRVFCGNIGSQTRAEYTVMGDIVNMVRGPRCFVFLPSAFLSSACSTETGIARLPCPLRVPKRSPSLSFALPAVFTEGRPNHGVLWQAWRRRRLRQRDPRLSAL